jgi:hypothetical protein
MTNDEILNLAELRTVCGRRIPDDVCEHNGIPKGDHYATPVYSEQIIAFFRAAYRMGQKDMRERAAALLDCTDLRALKDCPEQLAYVSSIATGYAKVIRAIPIEGETK